MPKYVFEDHASSQAFAASGQISLELAPKPYTITRMAIVVRSDITTGVTPGDYNDAFDRIISTISLTGKGKTFFNFTNMRAAWHHSRFRKHAPKRPVGIAASQTNALQQFAYVFHFGVCPWKLNPVTGCIEDNPFDLSAGIPPTEAGNLSLGGTYGAAAAPGSGYTVNDADFEVYLWGVRRDSGDPPELYLPRAFPTWSQRTPTPTATSGAFGTEDNVPAGGFLHSILAMMTNGTNAPRDDAVLGSLELYNVLEARSIWRTRRYKAGEILSQLEMGGWPPSDNNVTLTTPAVNAVDDEGLVWLPLHKHTSSHPLYGLDMRGAATGDLSLRYGVDDASGVTLDFVYTKYELNPEHPGNIAA